MLDVAHGFVVEAELVVQPVLDHQDEIQHDVDVVLPLNECQKLWQLSLEVLHLLSKGVRPTVIGHSVHR